MEEEDELFEVEFFLNTRVKDGKRYFKVRWKGFPPEEDTWEPEENVLECKEVLEAFWKKKRKNANKRQKIRRDRLVSEEGDQEPPSTSRENKPSKPFDIEPLGLTRQASKELAICLNKSRNSTKRNFESSSQTESDVTLVENDVSSKSTLASSQTGSDITSSDNDFSSQGSELKSSGTGSDALDQSSNENNATKDVIDVSSQDSLLNQSDFEFSPRETSSRNQAFENENARKIEVISLLSDSEDTEGESSETGNQLSGSQSPDVVQSSRDSTPVVRRESFKTPENTPSNSSQTNEPQDTKKATDHIPDASLDQLQSPSIAKESEGDPFGTSVRRKNRFELSLKKNRKRQLSTIESSSSESPKTEEEEEEALNVDVKKRDITSDENVFTTRGKTKLQILKENMLGLEKTERTSEQCDRFPEPTEPRAKRALVRGRGATSNSFDDECPTIIELKGIMHKIAKNKYQHHVEGNIRGTSEVAVGVEQEGSLGESSASTPVVPENVKIMSSGGDENVVPGDLDPREERDERYLNITDISEDRLAEDEDCCTSDEQKTSKEYNQTTRRKDEGKMNAMITKSLGEEIENENLKDVEEDEPNRKEGESGFDKGVDSERISNEGDSNSIGEAIAEKEMDTKRRKLGLAQSSGKKAVVLSSESTNRVLKNLRFLAAKRRKPKNIETTTSSTTSEKKSDDLIDSNVQIDVNSQNRNADDRDNKLAVEEELKVGNEKELKEKENKSEREIEGKNGDKEGNESKKPEQVRIENRTNDESGLIDAKKTKTLVYEDDPQIDNNIKSNAADTNENSREMNNSQDQREKMTNVGRSTDDKEKPPEEGTIEQVAFTSEITRDRSSEKNYIPSTKRKADDSTTVENRNSDSEISADVSTSKTPNSFPAAKSFSIHGGIRSQGCQGDQSINETLALDFQKHSTGESSAVDEKHRPEIKKSRKMSKKTPDKAASAKPSTKRMKLQQAKTKSLNSKKQDVEILDGGKTSSSSSSVKSKSQTSKTLVKRTNKAKMTKNEEIDATVKIPKPLQNAQEQKRTLVSDANFSSNLTSGDLIGAIIDGDQKTTLKHEQRKSIAKENSDSKALVAERQEEDVMIEDDEDFDFELEDFPLEKLLQEEDEIDLRSIPSPPVEPMDVPFASVKTAIRDGDEMTVRAALAGGLELDTLDGASGMTLLMLAAASGQDGVVELLLRRKADVNACQKNGMTALMHACEQGYPETAHVLLLCGADINKQQIAGETALMKACKKGHTDVVEVLLKNGADTRLESKSGHMAQQFAIRGYPELSSLMEEHEKRLGRVVEEAILKCLGDTVSLCKPAILYYRCVVPREGQQMTFPFHYTPQIYNKEVDVILFCIKAVFDDVVSLLFGEDNGVRGILLNNKSQIPLLHGVRSIFSIDPKSRQNTITLQTHKCSNPASRIILCIYAVQSKS